MTRPDQPPEATPDAPATLAARPRDQRRTYLPAPFSTVETYQYGPDRRINPTPDTRQG